MNEGVTDAMIPMRYGEPVKTMGINSVFSACKNVKNHRPGQDYTSIRTAQINSF